MFVADLSEGADISHLNRMYRKVKVTIALFTVLGVRGIYLVTCGMKVQ